MKMLSIFARLCPFIILSLVWYGMSLGGVFSYSGLLLVLVIHPIMDAIRGRNAELHDYISDRTLNFFTLAYVPISFVFLVSSFVLYSSSESIFEKVGLILSTGSITGGLGITVAHELIHRSNKYERGLGIFLLAMVNYSHFRVEHVYGHHRHVATPVDPASAQKGQSLYSFLPQSFFGGVLSAFLLDWNRLHQHSFLLRLLKNRTFHYLIVTVITSLYLFFTPQLSLIFWLGQSLFAIGLLEVINYIEHYGLRRVEVSPGKYAPVEVHHSWDCDFLMTNLTLFNLGRHSHHHFQASVPYWRLENQKKASLLPFGYSTAIVVALFPSLWKKIMDPLVDQALKRTTTT